MTHEKNLYQPVNWVDGMNINKKHFISQENAFAQNCMNLARLSITNLNYGLVKSEKGFLWMEINNELQLLVKFETVRFVFPSGFQLTISDDKDTQRELACELPLSETEAIYYVVLSTDPFTRQPVGMADASESPIRKPYVSSKLKISLVEENQVSGEPVGLNHIIIGRIAKEEGRWSIDTNYMIASSVLVANPNLVDVHKKAEISLTSIEQYSLDIVNKIRMKQQDNPLAMAFNEICQKLVDYLSVNMSNYRLTIPHQPPVEMVILVMNLARLFKNTINGWKACGKDEFMTYLAEWCNINQGDFEDMLGQMIKNNYDHNRINLSINKSILFLDLLANMLKILSGLDYIGKIIETDLFVKEEIIGEELIEGSTTAKNKRPFFFGKS